MLSRTQEEERWLRTAVKAFAKVLVLQEAGGKMGQEDAMLEQGCCKARGQMEQGI